MTESVKADDVLFLEGLEWRIFDVLPLGRLLFVWLVRLLLLGHDLCLLLVILSLLLGLLFDLLRDHLVVLDGIFECFISKA